MNLSSFSGSVYMITRWITRIAYLNFLWILFSMMGLLVFGVFPATIALFALCRKWINGEDELPVFRCFYQVFRHEFIKSNLLGLMLVTIGGIIYLDYLFLTQVADGFAKWILLPLIPLAIVFLLLLFFIFPVYVHYEATLLHHLKNAMYITILHPFTLLLMVLVSAVTYIVYSAIPALIPFFGLSIVAWTLMFFAEKCFTKLDAKRKQKLTAI
ncbi:YesL family protein [Sediminibacillus massiliensis]|uniref:YesL family protein n=1 Tax=Sediminibacillus massiliensis TaxID=1926277 RepID=UPI0009888D18|nr:YesL family protein [Sediminibacillus massiliensis]